MIKPYKRELTITISESDEAYFLRVHDGEDGQVFTGKSDWSNQIRDIILNLMDDVSDTNKRNREGV